MRIFLSKQKQDTRPYENSLAETKFFNKQTKTRRVFDLAARARINLRQFMNSKIRISIFKMEELPQESLLLETDIAAASKKERIKVNDKKMVMKANEQFDEFKIDSTEKLDLAGKERRDCPGCGKSRMYFCYSCAIPLPNTEDVIPRLALPCPVAIVKHPGEVAGKVSL